MNNPEKLRISTKIQVAKSREDIFQTITDRKELNKFFISEASSDLEAGKQITWKFPEFKFVDFSVEVLKVEFPETVVLTWEGADNNITTVTFALTEIEKNQTLVSVVEEEMQNDDEGIAWLGISFYVDQQYRYFGNDATHWYCNYQSVKRQSGK